MKLLAPVIFALGLASSALAESPVAYQVTGSVIELTDSKIIITKGKGSDKWEIARTADAKIPADLKVGQKVTIQYTMSATSVVVKEAKGKKAKPAEAPATPTAPAKKAA